MPSRFAGQGEGSMKVLLIDNYDSFIYNLEYDLKSLGFEVMVCRNDIDYDKLVRLTLNHDALVISPGPSNPENAGHCIKLVKNFYIRKPILGVCLGHQIIAEALGGEVNTANDIVHGKVSSTEITDSALFEKLKGPIRVARYHSLIVNRLPFELKVIAQSQNKEIMAIEHTKYPVYGLQFHPESIMTLNGGKILNNFKQIVRSNLSNMEIAHVANA